MPVYEYACKACGQHLEVAQSFKDEPLTTCPACGGALRKVFGSIGISFKGSGFYRTDSRTPTGKPAGKADGEKEKVKAGAGEKSATPDASAPSPDAKSSSGSSDGSAAKSAAKTA